MQGSTNRIYDMLLRLLVFATKFAQFFEDNSPTAVLIQRIKAAAEKLSAEMAAQRAITGDIKTLTVRRLQARNELKRQLKAVLMTAKALRLPQFWMPHERTDRALIDMADIFVLRAQVVKDQFVDAYLPLDFIERLTDAARELEKAIDSQTFEAGGKVPATTGITLAQNEAMAVVRQLDPLMENLLRVNPPMLAAWRSARHVERAMKRTTVKNTPEGASKAGEDQSEAAAA